MLPRCKSSAAILNAGLSRRLDQKHTMPNQMAVFNVTSPRGATTQLSLWFCRSYPTQPNIAAVKQQARLLLIQLQGHYKAVLTTKAVNFNDVYRAGLKNMSVFNFHLRNQPIRTETARERADGKCSSTGTFMKPKNYNQF